MITFPLKIEKQPNPWKATTVGRASVPAEAGSVGRITNIDLIYSLFFSIGNHLEHLSFISSQRGAGSLRILSKERLFKFT